MNYYRFHNHLNDTESFQLVFEKQHCISTSFDGCDCRGCQKHNKNVKKLIESRVFKDFTKCMRGGSEHFFRIRLN
jgi:hypothetical protein